jgi:hypothetical protein
LSIASGIEAHRIFKLVLQLIPKSCSVKISKSNPIKTKHDEMHLKDVPHTVK